uniref:Uncharacterized protein n=1 Tax=Avena sativa TaxID=4498 RepID=A0ACD5YWY8_AVESA
MEADLRELARLPDVLAVCSSAGWTDQKHVLYLGLLQESFVNQLHQGEIGGFRELLGRSPKNFSSPRTSGHEQSPKVDRGKSMKKVDHQEEDGEVHSTDDDASTAEMVQESSSSSQAGATSSGQPSSSSTSHCGKRKDSLSRTAAEGSDQNFVDEDAEGSGESRRRRGNKRLKSADDTVDDQARERRCIHEEGGTAASGLPQWKKRRGHRWP